MALKDTELSMETRMLLAIALSAIVLLVTAIVKIKLAPPPAEPPRPAAQKSAPGGTEPAAKQPAPGGTQPAATAGKAASGQASSPPAPPKAAQQETETVVENDLYRVAFSNRGAVVKSWTLKRYQDAKGRPLELVNTPAAAALGFPFLIWTDDEALRNKLGGALFEARASGSHAPAEVTFEYSDGSVSARKEFRFFSQSYVVDVSSELKNAGAPVAHELAWRGSFGDQTVPGPQYLVGVFYTVPGKLERKAYGDVEEHRLGGTVLYGGIEDMFFAAAFLPPSEGRPDSLSLRTFRSDFKAEGAEKAEPLVGVAAGGAAQNRMRIFVGPKALDVLGAVLPEPGAEQKQRQGQPVVTLVELVDYGWFTFIAKPLFLGLKWIYNNIVSNYGWAIVLITVIINAALFPLKLKSMKSALKMQKVAPQVRAIQEKYKKFKLNDPRRQQQNQEVMDLYRKHGINPIGGCFPILLQIPFLYGFYKVLSVSIEMRHARWFGWVKDLSAKDPYYVLPVVMTVSMFFLQKMTPQTTTDPTQQKMFLWMPVIFGVMFLNVSSGLVLYWLVGNLVGMAQQWYINRSDLGAAMTRRPALAGTKKP